MKNIPVRKIVPSAICVSKLTLKAFDVSPPLYSDERQSHSIQVDLAFKNYRVSDMTHKDVLHIC